MKFIYIIYLKVIKAVEKKTQQIYAIKRISKVHILKHNMQRSVYIERDILKNYPHKFIVGFYGQFQDEEYLCLFFNLIQFYF